MSDRTDAIIEARETTRDNTLFYACIFRSLAGIVAMSHAQPLGVHIVEFLPARGRQRLRTGLPISHDPDLHGTTPCFSRNRVERECSTLTPNSGLARRVDGFPRHTHAEPQPLRIAWSGIAPHKLRIRGKGHCMARHRSALRSIGGRVEHIRPAGDDPGSTFPVLRRRLPQRRHASQDFTDPYREAPYRDGLLRYFPRASPNFRLRSRRWSPDNATIAYQITRFCTIAHHRRIRQRRTQRQHNRHRNARITNSSPASANVSPSDR